MRNPKISYRYAKSIFEVALEKGELENVYQEFQFLEKLPNTNRDFIKMFESPLFDVHQKTKIVDSIFTDKISPLSLLFLNLLINKGREVLLQEICQSFIKQYKAHHHIQTIMLTTATEISDEMTKEIITQIKKTSDFEKIDLQKKIKPEIIGGFILETNDLLEDASVLYDLKQIANQFRNNDYIYKIR